MNMNTVRSVNSNAYLRTTNSIKTLSTVAVLRHADERMGKHNFHTTTFILHTAQRMRKKRSLLLRLRLYTEETHKRLNSTFSHSALHLCSRKPHLLRTVKTNFRCPRYFLLFSRVQQQCFHTAFHRTAPLRIDVSELWKFTTDIRTFGANNADTLSYMSSTNFIINYSEFTHSHNS